MKPVSFSLVELKKAVDSLDVSLRLYQESVQDQGSKELRLALRDSCIQRFEYSIELCWKTSMRILGSTTANAKPAVREMARGNLISNPDAWLGFIDSRNETSHAYDESTAQKVFAQVMAFLPEAKLLITQLESQNP